VSAIDATALDVAGVLRRLAELGPPSELRAHSPEFAASWLKLDRVLLTSIAGGMLTAEALHDSDGDSNALLSRLQAAPVALEYPLLEGEIMRRRRPQVVRAAPDEPVSRRAFADVLGWSEYATAPVLVDGRAIGFLHGDRREGGVEEADAEALGSFAVCFALVFERAVLRHRLRVQREQMRQMASWAEARTSELGERGITLGEEAGGEEPAASLRLPNGGQDALRNLLTARELEVLELMVRGETNAQIARDLVLSEGTIKFHVKNVLRKLHASNRAEATSRYLRLTLNRGG
jgi:LuxR family transcriptional regulator, regulator of acetate metabolism